LTPTSNLAAMAVDQERWKDAEAFARKALELDAKLSEAWNNLGVALDEQGHSIEGEKALRKALELEPTYALARENLSLTLKRRLENNAE
jgi:Flp pilus assembly protein TadD